MTANDTPAIGRPSNMGATVGSSPGSDGLFSAIGLLLLAGLTLLWQEQAIGGLNVIETGELRAHLSFLSGQAVSPWRFRVLMEWILEAALRLFRVAHVPRPVSAAYLTLRALQNVAIFGAAFALYRTLGLTRYAAMVGLTLGAFSMSNSFYGSGLKLDTYSELICYLIAALLVARDRAAWILPLTFVATLNRETAGLIALLPLSAAIAARDFRWRVNRRNVGIAAGSLAIWLLTHLSVRTLAGPGSVGFADAWRSVVGGTSPGLPRLAFQLTHLTTWFRVTEMMSVLPLLALMSYRQSPGLLRGWFVSIVPAWFLIHYLMANVSETRLFLVPVVTVLIPMVVIGAQVPGNS